MSTKQANGYGGLSGDREYNNERNSQGCRGMEMAGKRSESSLKVWQIRLLFFDSAVRITMGHAISPPQRGRTSLMDMQLCQVCPQIQESYWNAETSRA